MANEGRGRQKGESRGVDVEGAGYPWLLSTGSILQFTRRQLAHQKLPLWSVAIKMENGPIRNCRQEPGHLHELRLGNGAGRLLIK